jgi:hypothetical protein
VQGALALGVSSSPCLVLHLVGMTGSSFSVSPHGDIFMQLLSAMGNEGFTSGMRLSEFLVTLDPVFKHG